jgi:hypothetical protein
MFPGCSRFLVLVDWAGVSAFSCGAEWHYRDRPPGCHCPYRPDLVRSVPHRPARPRRSTRPPRCRSGRSRRLLTRDLHLSRLPALQLPSALDGRCCSTEDHAVRQEVWPIDMGMRSFRYMYSRCHMSNQQPSRTSVQLLWGQSRTLYHGHDSVP